MRKMKEIETDRTDYRAIIREAALDAYEKGDGYENGVVLLKKAVAGDEKLREALWSIWENHACREEIKHIAQSERRIIWKRGTVKSERSLPALDRTFADGGLQLVAESNFSKLLDMPVWGGKLLGECTREEVAAAAEKFYSVSLDMMSKGKFLALVAQGIPDGKKVKDVLSNDRLGELQLEAIREYE